MIKIYTDGASRGNPGPGGWGALIIAGNKHKKLKGAAENVTNNQMELMAPIKALSVFKEQTQIAIYTDSQYLQKGMNEWIHNWKRKNWRTASNKPVKNKELWQQLDKLCEQHQVTWHWVKGHSGDPGNEIADQIANEAIDEMLQSLGASN